MHFEFNNKQYNFKKLDAVYLEGESYVIGNQDVEKRDDLYCVTYQEQETGLIVDVQAGLQVDLTNNDYEVNNRDTITNWDYSQSTFPDDVDESDFEIAFEHRACEEVEEELAIKVANDEIPEVVEAIGKQIKEEPKQERSSRRRNRP